MKGNPTTWADDKTLADNPDSWPENSDNLPVVEPSHAPQNSDRIHISINNVTTKHSSRSFSTLMMVAAFTLLSILCFWHFGLSEGMRSFTITPFLVSPDIASHAEEQLKDAPVDSRDDEDGGHEQTTVTVPGSTVMKSITKLVFINGDDHVRTTRTLPGSIVTKTIWPTITEAASLHSFPTPSSLSSTFYSSSPFGFFSDTPFLTTTSSLTTSASTPSTTSFARPPIPSQGNGNCTSTYDWTLLLQHNFIETVYSVTENVTSWLDCNGCNHLMLHTPPGFTLVSYTSAILATGPTSIMQFSCLPTTGIALAKGTITETATVTAASRRTITATVTLTPKEIRDTGDTTSMSSTLKTSATPLKASAKGEKDLELHTEMKTVWQDVTVTNELPAEMSLRA
ncbi:Fc.00g085320.m01.CDS01 [Cosmosporella sp. VM-42]